MSDKDKDDSFQDNPAEMGDDLESLSLDEKAAFEKIMAEINGADQASQSQGPSGNPEEVVPSEIDRFQLDAHLNQENTKKAGKEIIEQDQNVEDSDDQQSDDQQAALDKIMAEINARETGVDTNTDENEKPPAETDQKSAEEGNNRTTLENRNENLSIDEFNDELNNLLSSAQLNAQSQPLETPSTSGSDSAPAIKTGESSEPTDKAPSETAAPDSEEPSTKGNKPPHYTILQEINEIETSAAAAPDLKAVPNTLQSSPKRTRRTIIAAVVGLIVIGVLGIGLWRYKGSIQNKEKPDTHQQQADAEPHPLPAPIATNHPDAPINPANRPISDPVPVPSPVTSSHPLAPASFGALKSDLMAARHQVNQKIQEIISLKAYYQKGIHNEQNKIWAELQDKPMPSLEKAIADNAIALSIRAIQRRMVYIAKLDAPLKQLQDSAEDLLYLERKTEFFETLSQWISGPSLPEYRQQISNRIQSNLKAAAELSVDQVQVQTPSETTVWKEIVAGFKVRKPAPNTRPADKSLNEQIGREICDGNYSRKYQLTSLSPETAQCLVQWSGKDLYLNELTELTPQMAKILVQWPGEWLSLNGLKEISPETAKYLSQWPGKHLSLNGLEKLSPQVTAQLSQWRGAQLEMVGLTAIGRWENYTTRLFLSEALRHKLQM